MRDIAMSNVKHEARVVWCVLVGRGGAAPWAARGQPSWGARAGGAAAGRFGPFAHSGRSWSRARSSSAKQRVLRAAPLAAGEISDPGRNTRGGGPARVWLLGFSHFGSDSHFQGFDIHFTYFFA